MTITSEDRERYQSTVTEFHTQPEPDSCFPTALKNIFDDLANRKDEPDLRHSISDIGDALDYIENRASASDRLAFRLDPLLKDAGYEVKAMMGVEYDQLQTIIDSEDRCRFVSFTSSTLRTSGNTQTTIPPNLVWMDSVDGST